MQPIKLNCLNNTIGYLLNELISLFPVSNEISKFTANTAPKISIEDYLIRLNNYLNCSESCFVFGIIYIDRIV